MPMTGPHPLEKNVAAYILRHQLLTEGEPVLVALSGGADSVALLLLLHRMGYSCRAVHCNFHLRGAESDRDQRFVEALCRRLNLSLHTEHFHTEQYAADHKLSIEMAARELRYDLFHRLLCETGIRRVAVAHHRMDQAETLFNNLLRGTGIRGLRGMLPVQGKVIRPLLATDKNELLAYLQENGESYITDSTNLSSLYQRNKIRLEILPALQEINPSALKNILRTMEHLAEAESIYDDWINRALTAVIQEPTFLLGSTPVTVSATRLRQNSHFRTVCHELLAPYGFNATQEQNLLNLPDEVSGREFRAPSWRLLVDRGFWRITSIKEDDPLNHCVSIPFDLSSLQQRGEVCLYKESDYSLYAEWLPVEELDEICKSRSWAYVDAAKIKFPLHLKYPSAGDRFVPFGMKGSRLLSDFLTDLKLSRWQKEEQSVLCDAENRIIWVVGYRSDNRFRITSETRYVLRFHIVESR